MHADFSSGLAHSVSHPKRNYSSPGDVCNTEHYGPCVFILRLTGLHFSVCSK